MLGIAWTCREQQTKKLHVVVGGESAMVGVLRYIWKIKYLPTYVPREVHTYLGMYIGTVFILVVMWS